MLKRLLTDNCVFSISHTVAWQVEQTNQYVYVMELNSQQAYKFDDVAGDIWKMISERISLYNIYKEICSIYDVTFNEVQEDLDNFIIQLLDCNLIVEYK